MGKSTINGHCYVSHYRRVKNEKMSSQCRFCSSGAAGLFLSTAPWPATCCRWPPNATKVWRHHGEVRKFKDFKGHRLKSMKNTSIWSIFDVQKDWRTPAMFCMGFSENDQLHHHKPCNSHGEITVFFFSRLSAMVLQAWGTGSVRTRSQNSGIQSKECSCANDANGWISRNFSQKKTNNSNGQVIRFSQHLVIKRIKPPFSDRPVDVLTRKPWFHPCREATKTWNHSQSGSFQSLFPSKLEVFSSMPNMGKKKKQD